MKWWNIHVVVKCTYHSDLSLFVCNVINSKMENLAVWYMVLI